MDKAAFALLDHLAADTMRHIRERRRYAQKGQPYDELTEELQELDGLWNEARAEQKGGT